MILPQGFIDGINNILSSEEAERFFDAMQQPPKVSVRINRSKVSVLPTVTNRVKWCESGFYLDAREAFTFDPLFQAGYYYVQDASSMIIDNVVKKIGGSSPIRYLDLCAAPGGKTTAAIDSLPDGSLMVCNEIIGSRAQILRENIIKWGASNCVVTNNDSAAIGKLKHYFDIVAADVPCSGEGMFRKDTEAVAQWNEGLVKQCADRQREIIDNIWDSIRPGGYLIYSTCTYNRAENEEMIDYITENYGASTVDLNLSAEYGIRLGIDTNHQCYRFMPHITDGEGLFISVLRKSDNEHPFPVSNLLKKKKKETKNKNIIPSDIKQMVNSAEKLVFTAIDDEIYALPVDYASDMGMLTTNLRVIYQGVKTATVKGKDLIPTQALALSGIKGDFPTVTVDYPTAIAYLRGEGIAIENMAKGICAIAYQGVTLGFIKNLGTRANNLYPKEWRIKSTHIPPTAPTIIPQ